MKLQEKFYDKKTVIKPWGQEHVAYRDKKNLAITVLNIKYKKKTSLHCHPSKKTGFILIKGKARIQLGLWKDNRKIFTAPDKLMIRTGLFHQIEAISKSGIIALEFETPVKKNDLVRFQDNYGRRMKPYEGKRHISEIKETDILFKKPKKNSVQKFKVGKLTIQMQTHTNFDSIINKKNSNIFAIIDGQVVDRYNRNILSYGDIIKTGTFKKLSKVFKIKKNLTLLSVS